MITKNSIIKVPKGIRFMSDWKEFSIPDYPCIIDKKIPGCGFTEYCISNNENVILCSPRKLLLENKENQHPNEVLYVRNELDQDETVDKDLEKITRSSVMSPTSVYELTSEDKKLEILENLKNQVTDWVGLCLSQRKPIKILVTYDSFRLVKETLGEFITNFRIIIDEFQSIFTDSRFKASTELEFLYQLNGIQRVCFVSATPMIDEYLNELDEFKDLPYYEFDWVSEDPLRVLKPDLTVKTCRSVNEPAYEIIDKYLNGSFDSVSYRDTSGKIQTIYSKEAVFYVNSVSNILGIINKCGLIPEQCNLLIARTPDNEKKIKKRLGKKWEIGSIPLKGEPHKMFTFCTRTVYLGADFYSDCAKSFIFSDANIDTLAVDISLDLPQILGRQRNNCNPWKNHADFYYKSIKNAKTKEDFDKYLALKDKKTREKLENYESAPNKHTMAEDYQTISKACNYRNDYVAVNVHNGKDMIPVKNELVRIAERRAFDIQQIDYKDRFSVFNSLNKMNFISGNENVEKFMKQFEGLSQFTEKMKYLCECGLSEDEISSILDQLPTLYKTAYLVAGPVKCKALKYQKGEIVKYVDSQKLTKSDLITEIYNSFVVGNIYSKKDIKEQLGVIYDSFKLNKTPKATDLGEYFELKECKKQIDNIRIECFKIIKRK